jgi:NitT/TauT family transport system substrate-binding protein
MAVLVAALAISLCLFGCDRPDREPVGPPEKITLACATLPETALVQVALTLGYFREEGLEVNAQLYPYGKLAIEDLLAGKADFATVAETPVMFAIMQGEKLAVLATIETSNVSNAILARKDRGIRSPEDLKGKKIAVTSGTILEFFLDSVLTLHGISRNEVEVVDLKVGEMAEALVRGDIDAVSTFTHFKTLTQRKLGEGAITFQDKDIYKETFNIVATQEYIRNNPGKIKKMLRALVRAEDFAHENPAETQRIVAEFSGIEREMVRELWADANFGLTLDQTLILALEDESRWAIQTGLTTAKEIPNYLDCIYFEGLKAMKPEAVNILR